MDKIKRITEFDRKLLGVGLLECLDTETKQLLLETYDLKPKKKSTAFYDILMDYLHLLDKPTLSKQEQELLEKSVRLFVQILGSKEDRPFAHYLIKYYHIIPLSLISHHSYETWKSLLDLLVYFSRIGFDDFKQQPLSREQSTRKRHDLISSVQRDCFSELPHLEDFIYASITKLETRSGLESVLSVVNDQDLESLCSLIMQTNIHRPLKRNELFECLLYLFEHRKSHIDLLSHEPLFDEQLLFDDFYMEDSGKKQSLLQLSDSYLSIQDYLYRQYQLFKLESASNVKRDIEDAILRLGPRYNPDAESKYDKTIFTGWSRNAVPITQVQIDELGPTTLLEPKPSYVIGEISFMLGKYAQNIKDEWDTLQKGDTLFLVKIEMQPQNDPKTNHKLPSAFKSHFGIKCVRICQVHELLGDNGQPVSDFLSAQLLKDGETRIESEARNIRILLDPNQLEQSDDFYQEFNILVRRKDNQFKSVLDTLRHCLTNHYICPDWIQSLLVDNRKKSPVLESVVFASTFVHQVHLKDVYDLDFKVDGPLVIHYPKQQDSKKRKKQHLTVEPFETDLIVGKAKIEFTSDQIDCIANGSSQGLTVIDGPPGSGKSSIAAEIAKNHYLSGRRVLIVGSQFNMSLLQVNPLDILHLDTVLYDPEGLEAKTNQFLERRLELLKKVQQLQTTLKIEGAHAANCANALYFYNNLVQHKNKKTDKLFQEIEDLRAFELLRSDTERHQLIMTRSKITVMTPSYCALHRSDLLRLGFQFDCLIIDDCSKLLQVMSLMPLVIQSRDLYSLVLLGNQRDTVQVLNQTAKKYGHLDRSLFQGLDKLVLNHQFVVRSEICDLYRDNYPGLQDIIKRKPALLPNPGFKHSCQFVHVPDFKNQGETSPRPGFYQNLGEAEYLVAVYQYMRILGYPAQSIALLTPYHGQKELILDVLERRCQWQPRFGLPLVERLQDYNNQADFVLCSLVRDQPQDEWHPVLEKARLGLYIFGKLHQSPVVQKFQKYPNHLVISKDIQSVVDMSKLVHQMSQEWK